MVYSTFNVNNREFFVMRCKWATLLSRKR